MVAALNLEMGTGLPPGHGQQRIGRVDGSRVRGGCYEERHHYFVGEMFVFVFVL